MKEIGGGDQWIIGGGAGVKEGMQPGTPSEMAFQSLARAKQDAQKEEVDWQGDGDSSDFSR